MTSFRLSRRATIWTAVIAVAITAIYLIKIQHWMVDYEVYRKTAIRVVGGEPLYRESDEHYQFKYLPAFAVLTIPLGLVPDRVGRAIWFFPSVLLLVVLLRTTYRVIPDPRRRKWVLIATTWVLLAKFYAHELQLGQVNILFTTLLAGAAWQMRQNKEWRAGFLIAAAVVVKPYAVLLGPYLLARRKLPSILSFGIGMVIALLLPVIFYGVRGNFVLLSEWWRTVTETTAPNLADFNNVSALSVFSRALGYGPLAKALALGVSLVLLGTAVAVFMKRRGIASPEGLEIGLLLTMIPILSPQGWDYVFLLSTIATMYLVNYRDDLPQPFRGVVMAALIVIGFLIWDVVGRVVYRFAMHASMITWCYLIVIAGLAALRFRRTA
jgi:hypothetical protein